MKKFALVSPLLPPTKAGQPFVLYNLLKDFDPNSYCLISEADYSDFILDKNRENVLSGKYTCIKLFFKNYFKNRVAEKIVLRVTPFIFPRYIDKFLDKRAKAIEKILLEYDCRAVIGCSGSIFDPVAAYYASRNLGLPFIFYIFDKYSSQFPFREGKAFTKKYEAILVKNSYAVIVTNEFIKNEYLKDYDVESTVIHNPVPLQTMMPDEKAFDYQSSGDKVILYAGSLYRAHYDAFRNLVGALRILDGVKLKLITTQRNITLKINGISGPVEYNKPKSQSEVLKIQKKSDILFLPLAFNSPYPELIKNTSPGKMGEYLVSGRPILVHAPADSYISWYFGEYECGVVVDRPDPSLLAEKISEILIDTEFRNRIVNNAQKRGQIDFSVDSAQEIFQSVIYSCFNGEFE